MNDQTEQPRVLLVEDDEGLVAAMAEYLSRHGLEPHVVHTGDAALGAIERVRPALVVLDIMLPGMDGFEVCRKLRTTNASLPVLMLTAKDEDFDRVLGLEIGADEYLVKPVQPRVLLAHIKAMLTSTSLGVPVLGGRAQLGTWQALYLIEHRDRPHAREVLLHFVGSLGSTMVR